STGASASRSRSSKVPALTASGSPPRGLRPGVLTAALGLRRREDGRALPSLLRGRALPSVLHDSLELLDRAVDQHLRGAVRAPERPSDLAIVHAQREPHDQGLPTIIRKLLYPLEDPL